MTSPLTTHNAEIRTAAVEISTLTISGKQVTLAVFRQLKETRLVELDGTLNGVPWGVVNYHPDKCAGDREHIHVVWQSGKELLRSNVPQQPFRPSLSGTLVDDFLSAVYCAKKHDGRNFARYGKSVGLLYRDIHLEGAAPEHAHQASDCLEADERLCKAHELLAPALEAEKARRSKYETQWQALNDLPQLFIAV